MPQVQHSVALESYLENVKTQLAEIKITKPKNNLSRNEVKALKELKNNPAINLKKRRQRDNNSYHEQLAEKIYEANVQLDNRKHYERLKAPMVKTTQEKVNDLINRLHQGKHIDDMTKKWLLQTPKLPRIPIFYTLTKIHKPKLVGRPIISGCDGPTERISSFVDTLLQPIAQKQKSFIKDTTDFISFIEKTKIGKDTILVSMDVSSLYTNIPQEEGTEIVCKAYDSFHNYNPPIPTRFLREMLGLQTHGTAMGIKMAVSFANIFMAKIETTLIQQSETKPKEWRRYIDDIFSLWDSHENILMWINLLNKLTNSTLPSNSRPKYQRTRLLSSDTVVYQRRKKPSQKNGDDILTISSPSGTVMKKTWINLLNKLTNSTLPSNSRPKYQRTRLLSSKQRCIQQEKETKPKEWRRYIDDIFSLWDSHEKDVDQFIEQANKFHPTIKFTAEISENEITFLDTVVFKGERFKKESILDIKTHYKPTETFQYTHFNSCHPPGVKNGFIKGEAMRLLRTNSSKTSFEESLVKFKQHLRIRGYPKTVIERSLSGVNFADRPSALTQKKKAKERILPFVTTYHPAVNNLKQTLMEQWSLIQNQPLLKTIYLKPPIISYKRGKSLKDTLVRSKI